MKQVFAMIAAAIACVALLFVAGGLLLSNRWKVERSVLIHAPASQVHVWVNDLHAWSKWEALNKADLSQQFEYSGPSAGVGATRAYRGQHSGVGSTTITKSDPQAGVWFSSRVNSESQNAEGSITYSAQGTATRVTWSDQGELPLIIGGYLRDSVEQGLGRHLDDALNQLKQLAEAAPPATTP